MKFELYTDAVLTRDVPEHRLQRCDIVKLVDHHARANASKRQQAEKVVVVPAGIELFAFEAALLGLLPFQ